MGELLNNYSSCALEAGCDEAGRGCLAGPVYAAAVILPQGYSLPGLNDSKKLTAHQRSMLRTAIERDAVAWCVASATAAEIDALDILRCSVLSMQRALDGLSAAPEFILVDGNRFYPYLRTGAAQGGSGFAAYLEDPANRRVRYSLHGENFQCIVHGDATYKNIAAASILAKTHRDEFMEHVAADYPEYGWLENKGYPTAAHRAAIAQYGITPYHRRTFALLPDATLF